MKSSRQIVSSPTPTCNKPSLQIGGRKSGVGDGLVGRRQGQQHLAVADRRRFGKLLDERAAGSKPLTSPPMRTGNAEASNSVIGPMPDRPADSADQKLSRPTPTGLTTPMPVMTTRSSSFVRCAASSGERNSFRAERIEIRSTLASDRGRVPAASSTNAACSVPWPKQLASTVCGGRRRRARLAAKALGRRRRGKQVAQVALGHDPLRCVEPTAASAARSASASATSPSSAATTVGRPRKSKPPRTS